MAVNSVTLRGGQIVLSDRMPRAIVETARIGDAITPDLRRRT
jgi:hypothetical protein